MKKKGFSLLELIFVIAVLGILSAIAIPKLLNSKSEASVSSIKQDISTITTSIQSYYMINGNIEKITDTVNVNDSVWNIEEKKLEYKIKDSTCVVIKVEDSKLEISIDKESSKLCNKIYESGVKSTTYELF